MERADEKIFIQKGKNACLYVQTLLKYRSTLNIGVSPSGKATDSDSVIRWFESSYPSHCEPNPNHFGLGFFVVLPPV